MPIWFININLLYLRHQTNKNMEKINKQDCIIQEISHNRVKVSYEPLEGINGFMIFETEKYNSKYGTYERSFEPSTWSFVDQEGNKVEPTVAMFDQLTEIVENAIL